MLSARALCATRFLGLMGLAAALACAAPGQAQQLPSAALHSIFPAGGQRETSFDVSITGADLEDATQLIFSHPGITATPKLAPVDPVLGDARPIPNIFTITIAADAPLGRHEVRALARYGLTNPRTFIVGDDPETVETAGAAPPSDPPPGGRRRRGRGGRRENRLAPSGNNTPASATEVELGSIANGRVDAGASDYFKIALKSGERFLVDCAAWRIDSRLRPVITLFDSAGNQLAQSAKEGDGDALLDFKPAADGEYVIELHDFTFEGGIDYFYRLHLGAGAIVESIFPPAAPPGVATTFTVLGRNLPGGQPAEGLTAGKAPLEQLSVQLTLPEASEPGGLPASHPGATHRLDTRAATLGGFFYSLETPAGPARPVLIGRAEVAPTIEQDPNDLPAQAQKITAPLELAGRFYPARDRDWITFDAKAGESYWIEVISHRAGIQSDPYFTIETVSRNEKGEETAAFVAEVDDPADRGNFAGAPVDLTSNDPSYRLDVGADATYRIMVRDLAGDARRDARTTYRLIVRPVRPDFQLVAVPSDLTVPANPNAAQLNALALRRGESTTADVYVERFDGFAGDVEVTVEGLPAGVNCPSAIVGPAMRSTSIVFTAAEDAQAWSGPVRLVGKAKVGDAEVVRAARAGSMVWGSGNLQAQNAQSRLTEALTLSILDKETAPATVVLGEPGKVFETSRGGTIDIPVKIARRGDYKAEVALAPVGLPNDLKPQNVTIKGDAADGVLQVVVNNTNVPAGTYTFRLQADTKFNYARNPEAAAQAEEDQKKVDAAIAERTEKNRLAQEAKTASATNAANAAAALQAAQQAKAAADAEALAAAEAKAAADAAHLAAQEKAAAAEKAQAEAAAAVQAADEAKLAAEKAAAESEATLKQAQDRKPAIDQRVNEAKAAAAPKEVNLRLVSTPLTLRIAPTPIKFTVAAPAAAIKQGEKGAVAVALERLYGFADQVDFTLEPPSEAAGLAGALSLANGQNEGSMEITAAPEAAPGEHAAIVRARLKFNNINLEATETVKIVVEKTEPAAAQ